MVRRPLILIAIAFIFGILIDEYLSVYPQTTSILLVVFSIIYISLIYRYKRLRSTICIVAIVVVSVINHNYRLYHSNNDLTNLVTTKKSLARLKGVIIKPPVKKELFSFFPFAKDNKRRDEVEKIIFLLKVKQIWLSNKWVDISGNINVSAYQNKQTVLAKEVEISEKLKQKPEYGDEVEVIGYLYVVQKPTNPGQFNYQKYLLRSEPPVTAMMYTKSLSNIALISKGGGSHILSFVYSLRAKLHEIIYSIAPERDAPIISSLLLGERENVPEQTRENFIRTGTIHFLAISGLHIGILVVSIHLILKYLRLNSKTSAFVIIVFVMLYVMLTGMHPPVFRAGIMVAVYYGAKLIDKRWDFPSGISAAALLCLIINPDQLFSVSFQLSFIALIGIVVLANRIESIIRQEPSLEELLIDSLKLRILRYVKTYCLKAFSVSLAAWLAVFPLVAFYFHIISPISIAFNIIVFPFIWLILTSGFILLVVGSLSHIVALPFAFIASFADRVVVKFVSVCAIDNISYFYTSGANIFWIIIYYSMVGLLVCGKRFNISILKQVIICLLVCCLYTFSCFVTFGKDKLRMTCFDVNHGTAIIIELPNNKTILYDAGTYSNYDIGKNIVAPFLWKEKIRDIDVCVVTHKHIDHLNGLPSIFQRFKIKNLFTHKRFLDSEVGNEFMKFAKLYGIKTSLIHAGKEVEWFDEVKISILNPPEELLFSKSLTINDTSIVLKIEYLDFSILLCADVGVNGIYNLITNYGVDLQSDIIVVPHHGGYIENTNELIKYVQPQYAIISGKTDGPSPETIETYRRNSVNVYQTCNSGAITTTIDKNGIKILEHVH